MSSSKLSSRQKPRGICTPYAFFLNICREKCSKKLSKEVDFNMLSAICWEKWNVMTEFQKRRFIQMSKYDELRYEKEMIEYKIANRKICVPFTETEDLQLIKVLIPLPVGEWRNQTRPMLANVLADNFETLGAVDWTFVLTYPEFSGHTVKSLKRMFHVLRKNMCHKQKVGASEVSLKQVATFAAKSFHPRKLPKNIEKRQRELIDYFERKVNAKNIENFV